MDETINAVAILFGAFGKSNEVDRQAIYCRMLSGMPYKLLMAGIERAINTRTFLPTVSQLKEDCRSVATAIDDSLVAPPWHEAWKEIERVLRASYWTEKPKFSAPEIAEAVECYGWMNLYMAETKNWQSVHAQLRDIYNTICERRKDDRLNKRIADKHCLGAMRKQITDVVKALDMAREVKA